MPGDNNVLGLLRALRAALPDKPVPLLTTGPEFFELYGLVVKAHPTGVNMHPIRRVGPHIPQHIRAAPVRRQIESHPTPFSVGNLVRAARTLNLRHLGGGIS